MNLFPELPATSKVWLYAANREFTQEEEREAQHLLNQFIAEWAAHGSQLHGNAGILHKRFVILAVDQSKVYASGCSIDASTNFIKQLGKHFQIDFFNRLNVYIEHEGNIQSIHFSDLANFPEGRYFDLTVNQLDQIRSKWPVLVGEQLIS